MSGERGATTDETQDVTTPQSPGLKPVRIPKTTDSKASNIGEVSSNRGDIDPENGFGNRDIPSDRLSGPRLGPDSMEPSSESDYEPYHLALLPQESEHTALPRDAEMPSVIGVSDTVTDTRSLERHDDPGFSYPKSSSPTKRHTRSSGADIIDVDKEGQPHPFERNKRKADRDVDAGPSSRIAISASRHKNGQNNQEVVLIDEHGDTDNLESHSEKSLDSSTAQRPLRMTTSPPAKTDTKRLSAQSSSSDGIQFQPDPIDPESSRFAPVTRSAPNKTSSKPVTYGKKGKGKDLDFMKPSSLKQGQLPYGTPLPLGNDATGHSAKSRKGNANQKRQSEAAPESATSSKKKKIAKEAEEYIPAKSGPAAGGSKKGRRKGLKTIPDGKNHAQAIELFSEDDG